MSSTATAVGRALQRWGAAALRGIGRPEGWLILLAVASRWPLRGRWLYHWDSVNFALALDRFDVARGQPHVPGYPLYVGLGWISRRIFGDPQTALVALSVAGTAMAAVLLYRLGEEWIGRGAGKWAALFWLSSPLVWFYGEIALPHALDAGFVLLVVWLAGRCARGERWHLPLAVALAASSGLRPQNLLFLGPIFLWGLQSQRWRARAEALISLGGLTLLWLIPLLALSGGPGRYLEISRAYNAHFLVLHAGLRARRPFRAPAEPGQAGRLHRLWGCRSRFAPDRGASCPSHTVPAAPPTMAGCGGMGALGGACPDVLHVHPHGATGIGAGVPPRIASPGRGPRCAGRAEGVEARPRRPGPQCRPVPGRPRAPPGPGGDPIAQSRRCAATMRPWRAGSPSCARNSHRTEL